MTISMLGLPQPCKRCGTTMLPERSKQKGFMVLEYLCENCAMYTKEVVP